MSYKVLARKWRPKLFNEVVGQDHITRTLKNSILNDKVAHAYLLAGTRGIGKTSIARIFAKAIRCENRTTDGEPCLVCDSCLEIENLHSMDYLEIDGASNNSVENIRDLVEAVQYLPAKGRYKVYVIDEVHMLTVSAFNALLKTLEEPPAHVIFIFATTDPQKLLGTVLSRCQRFDFKNSTIEDLTAHIKDIACKENIVFSHPKIITEIAKQAKGSIRDALSIFDQVIALSESGNINEETLNLSLGMVKSDAILNLLRAILNGDKKSVVDQFELLIHENMNLKIFSNQLLDFIYDLLISTDPQGLLPFQNQLDGIENISMVELMWIYENLSKDISWSLTSLNPENNLCFSLFKMAVREKIINADDTPLQIKKNSKVATNIDCEASIEPKSWQSFISFVYEEQNTLAMNLERGNLLSDSDIKHSDNAFLIAFEKDCKIFYDYLNNEEKLDALKIYLAKYLNRSTSDLIINLQLLNEKEKEERSFKSSLEIEESRIKQKLQDQRHEILNNKYIKEAENLFNSQVNKVILNNEH